MNKAEAASDSVKSRKKIVILKKDANGKLIKAHPFILKGKKKILEQQQSATRDVELARKAQMVAKGEYRDKERPFAVNDNWAWAKYICPTGYCSVCGQYYKQRGRFTNLQKHMQVSNCAKNLCVQEML